MSTNSNSDGAAKRMNSFKTETYMRWSLRLVKISMLIGGRRERSMPFKIREGVDHVGLFLLLQELRLFILSRQESSSNFRKNNSLTVSKAASSANTDGHPMLSPIFRLTNLSWRVITHTLGNKKTAHMMLLKE